MRLVIVILCNLMLAAPALALEKLTIVTDVWPPFVELKNGIVSGTSTDIVRDAMARTTIPYEIITLPWARAYRMAQTQKNVAIFTIIRTEMREKKFRWIAEIHPPDPTYLYSYDTPRKDIDNLDKAKNYSISATRDSMVAETLIKLGHKSGKNLTLTIDAVSAIRMAHMGRTSFVAETEGSINYYMQQNPETEGRFYAGPRVLLSRYYVAASPQTPESVIQKLKSAFVETLKEKGRQSPPLTQ